MKVSEIILQQMGGQRLKVMVGAYNFLGDDKSLSFRFKGSKVANYLKITLNRGRDTYDLEFGKVWGANYKVVKELEDVYADDLRKIFEDTTKLYLSF